MREPDITTQIPLEIWILGENESLPPGATAVTSFHGQKLAVRPLKEEHSKWQEQVFEINKVKVAA